MRTYQCLCGNALYFDNCLCLRCGCETGHCPECRQIVSLVPTSPGPFQCGNPGCGAILAKCVNYVEHHVCNRCVAVPPADPTGLCDCCRFNSTIPDLTVAGNQEKWYRLEAAKRRLFYDLDQLGLPYGTAADGIEPSLAFDFKADVIPEKRWWRNLPGSEQVFTGHANGLITINIREADSIEREKLRVILGEHKRTLIGHFRHEIGHFYWDVLVKGRREERSIEIFGDHNNPTYAEALETYYQNGAPADWATRHISAYASMHPWEDFAETWALYLSMVSELDTAFHVGFIGKVDPVASNLKVMVTRYQELGIALNELNRSMGLQDVVPEIIVPAVVEKLAFIQKLIQAGREENGILQPSGEPFADGVGGPAASADSGPTPAPAPAGSA